MPATTSRRLAGAATTLACVAALLVGGAAPAQAAPVNLAGANWIWYPDGNAADSVPAGTRYLRRTFTAPSGVVDEAQLVVTGDDSVDVWLNGVPLASSANVVDSWRQALYVDLAGALRPGAANTLAVAARNTAAGPAGVLGRLRVVAAGGTVELVTDASWKAANGVALDWTEPASSDVAWPAARVAAGYGAGPWGSGVTGPDLAAGSPLAVTAPVVERRVTPIGIDAARPRFGWKASGPANSELLQGAYQVVVSASEAGAQGGGGDVWDSGRVVSGRSVDAAYGGPALASRTRYWWRVRVWDTQGRQGAWGPVSWFETGQYDPAGVWQAAFVGSSAAVPALTGASWIWYPEGDPGASAPVGPRYLRRTFTLPAGAVTRATLTVTGDDTADVWVNGTQVSTSPRVYESWKTAAVVDVTGRVVAGANTIAIATENTTVSPAGVIAALEVVAGGTTRVVSDAAWKASQSGPAGWQNPGFADGGWPAARAIAGYGAGPWGSQVSVVRGAPYLRKGFSLAKPVASARLMVTALGLHETRINGAKVGGEALAPGWTDYDRRVQYRILDVTSAVRQGDNAIGAYLGNGWYSGSLGMGGNQRYGSQPWYSADLVVRYTDGTTTTVRTDGSWRTSPSPIRFDDIYHGEEYDARGALADWDQPGFDDSGWAAVTVRAGAKPNLVAAVDPGVAVRASVPAVAVTQPRPGVWVVDLGQNFAGWNRLRVRGPAGTTVTMRHAEVLNADGTAYTANLRAARATDRFTLAGTGADEVYEPRFTVHGYRYVELTGFPGTPSLSTVTGLAAWTNGAATGSFSTSSALVNQIQRNILWGQRSNMLTIPTDCPQRDERLGWTGDIAAFVGTSTFNMDVHGLLDKFTDDLTDAQRADGAFTDVAPAVCCGAGTAGWGDAGVIVPYTVWQRYGDLRIVDENFEAMRRWVDYSRSTSGANLIRDQWTYGDWLNVGDNTANDLISTAYFGYTARLVSRMAAATGRTAEASSYGALADQVAAAFTNRFVAADGTVSGNTQTGYVLALSFGLVPAARVQAVADKLAAKVASRSGHLSVGFLGVENLLPVLAENGHLATAYQVLTQPDYPGWGYMGARGGTTIWERWDGIRIDGSFQDPGMNSFNHYGLGSVGDFLYRSVGGVGPDPRDPGYHRLVIAPRPGGGLTSGRSDLQTPYGRALSDWSVSGGTLTLRVEVPANSTATVRVPAPSAAAVAAPPQAVPMGYASGAAVFALAAGSYTFTV
ncbi:family 78 glycoside hydrolase catalytic domain [Asanoa sp. NPDC050611]|uniref:family 78 glycoside hydrolase catalytic domain n=1 Tax=Asanoa sp. NPDC050611 TaxID=3157098 RepID=UPI0033DC37BD